MLTITVKPAYNEMNGEYIFLRYRRDFVIHGILIYQQNMKKYINLSGY